MAHDAASPVDDLDYVSEEDDGASPQAQAAPVTSGGRPQQGQQALKPQAGPSSVPHSSGELLGAAPQLQQQQHTRAHAEEHARERAARLVHPPPAVSDDLGASSFDASPSGATAGPEPGGAGRRAGVCACTRCPCSMHTCRMRCPLLRAVAAGPPPSQPAPTSAPTKPPAPAAQPQPAPALSGQASPSYSYDEAGSDVSLSPRPSPSTTLTASRSPTPSPPLTASPLPSPPTTSAPPQAAEPAAAPSPTQLAPTSAPTKPPAPAAQPQPAPAQSAAAPSPTQPTAGTREQPQAGQQAGPGARGAQAGAPTGPAGSEQQQPGTLVVVPVADAGAAARPKLSSEQAAPPAVTQADRDRQQAARQVGGRAHCTSCCARPVPGAGARCCWRAAVALALAVRLVRPHQARACKPQ